MSEKISLRMLKIILTPKEMRNVTGGSGLLGDSCYESGQYGSVLGVRCYNGQCLCDIMICETGSILCEEPCGMHWCSSVHMDC